MNDDVFNMFYPLDRKPQEILARAVQTSNEKFADILAQAAKQYGCKQTHDGNTITWLDDGGVIQAMFFRILDPRNPSEIRKVYDVIIDKKCPLVYTFIRQIPDGEEAWDIFRLSERSFMEHCNRISGPGSCCGDDEDNGSEPKKFKVENINIAGSEFRHVNMSNTVFEDIDFSGAKFFNINLRDSEIGAVDFGGASFSCMNTGEGHPRKPAVFNSIELDDCTIQKSFFRGTKIVNCDLTGMTIDGVLVTDMVEFYKKANPKT